EHSSDGINWTPLPDGAFGANTRVIDITHGNGRSVAIIWDRANEQSTTVVSTDGINWLPQTNVPSIVSGTPTEGLGRIAFGGGNFVAVGHGDSGFSSWGIILHSSDGINWTRISNSLVTSSVVYGGGHFVAVGVFEIMLSTDGINWTTVVTTNAFR
ncbi:MAG: hypothetical protein FWG66_00165, partial [Spirochaetes bacterium]|nr:hypothetical protein [Spirochaetota bacterium]